MSTYKDAFGRELDLGDEVASITNGYGSGVRITHGFIVSFTPKKVRVQESPISQHLCTKDPSRLIKMEPIGDYRH